MIPFQMRPDEILSEARGFNEKLAKFRQDMARKKTTAQRERDRAQKRGSGRVPFSLDFDDAENRYHLEPEDLAIEKFMTSIPMAPEKIRRSVLRLRRSFCSAWLREAS